jgi:hypothetical protein
LSAEIRCRLTEAGKIAKIAMAFLDCGIQWAGLKPHPSFRLFDPTHWISRISDGHGASAPTGADRAEWRLTSLAWVAAHAFDVRAWGTEEMFGPLLLYGLNSRAARP